MLFNMMVASALGTLISLCVAYLYVYRREWMDRLFPGSRSSDWGRVFSRLVGESKQKMGTPSDGGKRTGASVGASRSSKQRPQWLVELENLAQQGDSPNSDKLISQWERYAQDIYVGGAKELKPIFKEWERTKASALSGSFFKRLMIELLEQKAGYRNASAFKLREINDFNRLVVAVASLLLLIEDAEKGSRSLTRSLIKNQASERRVFLAIEYWLFLKTGAAKNALLAQLLKPNHRVGQRISSLSYQKRVRLCLMTLTTDWGQLPDQKSLLASFVKVIDEIASEEVKQESMKREQSRQQKSKKENKQKQKTPRPSTLTKKEEYLLRLGLSATSDFRSVRKAYKKLAMEKHPDRLMASSPSEMELKRAHVEFLQIQEAYHYLEKNMGDHKKSA